MTKEQCNKCEQRGSINREYCWWNGMLDSELQERDNEFWKNCDYKSKDE